MLVCAMCSSVHQSAGTAYGSIKYNTSQLPDQVRCANAASQTPRTSTFLLWDGVRNTLNHTSQRNKSCYKKKIKIVLFFLWLFLMDSKYFTCFSSALILYRGQVTHTVSLDVKWDFWRLWPMHYTFASTSQTNVQRLTFQTSCLRCFKDVQAENNGYISWIGLGKGWWQHLYGLVWMRTDDASWVEVLCDPSLSPDLLRYFCSLDYYYRLLHIDGTLDPCVFFPDTKGNLVHLDNKMCQM